MEKVLQENELTLYLELLKDTLQNFDYSSVNNVIFINVESFYSYIDKFCLKDNKSLNEIMSIIEPCIPLTLCVDSDTLEIFIQASMSSSEIEIRNLEDTFYRRARIDFMNTIRKAKTDTQWNYILDICQNLRKCIYN